MKARFDDGTGSCGFRGCLSIPETAEKQPFPSQTAPTPTTAKQTTVRAAGSPELVAVLPSGTVAEGAFDVDEEFVAWVDQLGECELHFVRVGRR
jgi:hypothetical protein